MPVHSGKLSVMAAHMCTDAPLATNEGLQASPIRDLAATRDARSLLANGVSIAELKRLEFSASELKEAGCSAKDLQLTYSFMEIRSAGFEPLVLLDCGWYGDQFAKAGFTSQELINAGFSAEQLSRVIGLSHLKDMGILQLDISWLLEGGFSANDLRKCNFDALRLKNAGCTVYQLRDAGFPAYELKQAGIDASWLLAGGWKASELSSRVDDLVIFSASEMREAGTDPKSLAQLGYTSHDLQACGYSLTQLSDAGVQPSCSTRDCCIDMFERVGCEHIPHEPLETGYGTGCCWRPSEYIFTPCQIIAVLLSVREWSGGLGMRLFRWFFHPFEAFLGMCVVCNMRHARALKSLDICIELLCSFFLQYIVGFAYSIVCSVVSLFACLPCFICFSLSRCVRKFKASFNDALFWIIYTPLLCMAMSGRYVWSNLCCRRSCFAFSRGPCAPSCTLKHTGGNGDMDFVSCVRCGRDATQHGNDFHTCKDGRRGSFLWTGPEYDDAVEQHA